MNIIIPILLALLSYNSLYNFKFINEGAMMIKNGYNILDNKDITLISLSTIKENKNGKRVHKKF